MGAVVGQNAGNGGGPHVVPTIDSDPSWLSPATMQFLWDLRCSGHLCDGVILTSDGGEFPVHIVIMATCSEYFRALFESLCRRKARTEVVVPAVSKAAMDAIVQYAYKRVTWVGCDNVESVLEAADYLCIEGMKKDCTDFLQSIMAPDNCISIQRVARLYNCFELATKAYNFLMRTFVDVSKDSEELLCLGINDVEAILSDENLNVTKEETVWEVALRWIEFDPEHRKRHISRVLNCVRTGLMDTDFFVENIKGNKLVAEDESCRPQVIETLRFLYDLDVMVSNKEVPTPPFARPRLPHEVLFVIGGWRAGAPTSYVETYDTRADRWINVDIGDPCGPRAYHKCAVIGSDIYIIGGFDGEDYFSSVRCFNAETKQWRSVTPMHIKRCYVSVAVLDDIIYAMGGYDGRHRQNTAERFDYRENQWTLIAPMNTQRSDACATSHGGFVYVTGGFSGNECLSSAERYDPAVGQWTLVATMRFRRSGVCCVGFRDAVYAIGGYNGNTRLSTAEKYNPKTNTWSLLPNMNNNRSNFAVAVIDNLVFAIGGFNGESAINLTECYDPATDQWYEATDLNECRSAVAACVVSGLPNIRDYIHQQRENLMEEKRQKMLEVLRRRCGNLGQDSVRNR
ncbi:kelch-like protein 10 [Haemaphysalis longicornis]